MLVEVHADVVSWPALDDQCEVYRIASKKSQIDSSGRLVYQAFIRRGANNNGFIGDATGLSVNLNSPLDLIVKDWAKSHSDKPPLAVGKIIVGEIRTIQFESHLDVIQNKLTHANIVGLPAAGQDVAKAEKLATELAGISTLIYPQNDQQNHKGSL